MILVTSPSAELAGPPCQEMVAAKKANSQSTMCGVTRVTISRCGESS